MLAQINFTADQDLKKAALAKAKSQGIPLKVLLSFFLKSYVEGEIEFGLQNSGGAKRSLRTPQEHANTLRAKKDKLQGIR